MLKCQSVLNCTCDNCAWQLERLYLFILTCFLNVGLIFGNKGLHNKICFTLLLHVVVRLKKIKKLYIYFFVFSGKASCTMAVKERVEAVLNVGLRVPSIMLLEVLYRWDVSSFFQKIQRSSMSNNPLFQYKYLALYLHYVGESSFVNV